MMNRLEGIVAKRRSSPYRQNSRAGEWVKVKVRPEQEFVVVGWTPGKNGRAGRIGGLILAYYDGDDLVYAGRAGGGDQFDRELETKLATVDESPLAVVPKAVPRERTWVHPDLVVQVAYQRWTEDGVLWHPVLKTIRDDKSPRQVTKEGLER
jgi:bifunctional non-homologous end joining protein LigD